MDFMAMMPTASAWDAWEQADRQLRAASEATGPTKRSTTMAKTSIPFPVAVLRKLGLADNATAAEVLEATDAVVRRRDQARLARAEAALAGGAQDDGAAVYAALFPASPAHVEDQPFDSAEDEQIYRELFPHT